MSEHPFYKSQGSSHRFAHSQKIWRDGEWITDLRLHYGDIFQSQGDEGPRLLRKLMEVPDPEADPVSAETSDDQEETSEDVEDEQETSGDEDAEDETSGDTQETSGDQEETSEDESPVEPTPAEAAILKQYYKSGGVYDLPDVGIVRGKPAALEALRRSAA